MDGIANRFVQLQGLQESLLKQIREFKQSGDPAKLPDIVEANRLDDELQDLARELDVPSDSSPSNNSRRRRSQINHQFRFVTDPSSTTPNDPSLFSVPEQPKSSTTSSRRSSLTLPVAPSLPASSRRSSIVQPPSIPATVTPIMSQTPQQVPTPSIDSSVSHLMAVPSLPSTPPPVPSEPVAADLLSPTSRQRRRQIESFQIPDPTPVSNDSIPDQSNPVSSETTESVVVVPQASSPPIASFGEFMKAFAQPPSEISSELSISEINENPPLEILQEAPPITRSPRRSTLNANLNYQIPPEQRVVYEPEKFSTPKTPSVVEQPIEPSVVDQVKDAFSGIVESLSEEISKPPAAPPLVTPSLPIPPRTPPRYDILATPDKSLRSRSPLRDSNRRRSALGAFTGTSNEGKFWESVHHQRIKVEKITTTVTAITALLDAHKTESGNIRVKKFGILGEYLFIKQREYRERLGRCVEAATTVPDPVVSPRSPPSMFETIRAVLLIQRYFRRFVKRRRDRIEAVKNLASTEATDARDKLRKRRLERKTAREDSLNVN